MIWPIRKAGPARNVGDAPGYSISPEVTASPHARGIVFLHRTRGAVFASNGIGARIWRGSGEGKSIERIAAEISREFGVPGPVAERDAREFLGELETAGILVRNPAGAGA